MLPTQSKATRRKVELDTQIAFLQEGKQVRLDSWPRKLKAQQEPYPLIIRRKFRTLDEYRRMIWLRFQSLTSMDYQWHTAKQVLEMTGVSYKTQYAMVGRWVERGFKIVSLLCLRGRKVKVDESTREMIASPAMLMAQRHMSLH